MSEKTEPPTPKKIRDAREKGQFLFSREIVAGALMIAISFIFFILYPFFLAHAHLSLGLALDQVTKPFADAWPLILFHVVVMAASILGPVMGTAAVVAIVANVAQTGPVFSPAKLQKGMQSINFIANGKNLFSKRTLFNFGMSLVKLLLISYIVWLVLFSFIGALVESIQCGLVCMSTTAAYALGWLFAILAAAALPVAVVDFILQRHFYLKELKMSIDEVKREYKEMEGNPEIKAQRRQAHQEILQAEAMGAAREASVLVKNPDHYAVALYYDAEKMPLPLVTAKGEGWLAQSMIREAEKHGVPVYENIDLAQGLFHDSPAGQHIARHFIQPVAVMLRFLQEHQYGQR